MEINTQEQRYTLAEYTPGDLLLTRAWWDDRGGLVVPAQYRLPCTFHEGLAILPIKGTVERGLLGRGRQWACIDRNGSVRFLVWARHVSEFHEGVAAIVLDGGGYVDGHGTVVISRRFDSVGGFSEGLASAGAGNRLGFIDRRGHWLIAPRFSYASPFSEGLARVTVSDSRGESGSGTVRRTVGFIGRNGDWVVPPRYSGARSFSSGLAAVQAEGEWGYVDPTGKAVIACSFEEAKSFVCGRAAVRRDGMWGYIDHSGEVAVPFVFDNAGDFSEGLAAVSGPTSADAHIDAVDGWTIPEGSWGYIDVSGSVVIPFRYFRAEPFRAGVACTQRWDNDLWRLVYEYINRHGEAVMTFYDKPGLLWRSPGFP
ncbi:MAG: WG repeat-containing protein [Thermoleophilia bacterium]|nr:WG repeat-containing protein [Thermoleophilia bacterium]